MTDAMDGEGQGIGKGRSFERAFDGSLWTCLEPIKTQDKILGIPSATSNWRVHVLVNGASRASTSHQDHHKFMLLIITIEAGLTDAGKVGDTQIRENHWNLFCRMHRYLLAAGSLNPVVEAVRTHSQAEFTRISTTSWDLI